MLVPYAIGQRGAVAAAHPLAVEAGLAMLREGGNAMDAAVATAFALTVLDPGNASLGGRGSLVAYLSDDARLLCLDFNTVCPRNARPGAFEVVPTREGDWWSVRDSANTIGHRAVSVPTTAAGLCAAARYARLPLATLVAPAAEIARSGFPVTVPLEMQLASARERILPNAASRAIYAPSGRTLRRGETLANPDLSRTLRQLGEAGRDLIYGPGGEVGRALASDMAANGGLIDAGDLTSYHPTERVPATITYRGHELAVTPVNNGGPTVLEALRILEGLDLGEADPYSPEVVHAVIEALKLAWADRFAYLADPAFARVPLAGLLSADYAATRRALIDPSRADPAPAPGDPFEFDAFEHTRTATAEPRHPDVGGHTTYCCAADAFGGFVSLTHTLGSSFGSGVTVPGAGVLLNNGMYWFDPVPGRVNSIAPGKVPLNNQAETLVLEGGRPWLAIGLPGGRRILTTLTRALGLILDHGMSPAAALSAPRLHVEDREPVTFESSWKTDVPGGMDLLLDLQALGHGLVPLPSLERFISGPAHAVWSESGQLHAAGDPRQPGAAGAI